MITSFIFSATVSPPPVDEAAESETLITEAAESASPVAESSPARRVPVWVWVLLVAAVVILCLCCLCATLGAGIWLTSGGGSPFRTSTPGIDTPITIEGVQIQLASATRQDSYKSSMGTHRPRQASDEFLVVEATVLSGGNTDALLEWKVFTTDENGRQDTPSINTVTSDKDKRPTKIIWLIAVARASRSFTLHLPGEKTINLAPLLSR